MQLPAFGYSEVNLKLENVVTYNEDLNNGPFSYKTIDFLSIFQVMAWVQPSDTF